MKMEQLLETIAALSDDDFEVLINEVDKQKKTRARDILAKAQRLASRFTKDIETVASKPRSKRPPKFANPQNPEQTWSGMGRQPEWYKEYLAGGGQEKDLLIK